MSDIKEWAHEKAGTNTPPKTIPTMLGINDINKLQMENEAYKQSENEAKEIITELKQKVKKLQERKDKYYLQTLDDEVKISELITLIQNIKIIAEKTIIDYADVVANEQRLKGLLDISIRMRYIIDLIKECENANTTT